MADVTVRVKAEPEFAEAESEARGSFGRIESDARSAAEGIEEPFERAAAEVGGSFDRVEGQVRGSLDGLESVADRAADGIAEPFDRAAADIGSEFDGIDTDLRRSFDRAETVATSAADGIADQIGGIGDRVDLGDLGGTVADGLQSALGAGGPVLAVVGSAAALLGGELAEGISDGFSRRANDVSIGIRTGLDQVEVREAGEVAGQAYSAGFGDGLSDLRFEVAAVQKELGEFTLGTDDLQLNKELQLLQDQFGIELPRSVEIAQRSVANELAPTVTRALDGIFTLASELPLTFDEGLDVLNEYAPTFGGLNVSMDEFVGFLIEIQRSGAFENIDKGADAIREFNTRLTETDTLGAPLRELGLDAERLQQGLADGDIAGVIGAIVAALSEMEDEQRANEIAGELFGSAVEDVTDRVGALTEVQEALNGTLDDTTGSLDDATKAYEENRSGLDELRRDTVSFTSGAANAYGEYYRFVSDGTEDLIRSLQGAVEPTEDLAERLEGMGDGGQSAAVGMGLAARAAEDAAGGVDDFTLSAEAAADGIGATEEAVEGLVGELDSLLNFSADQLMRNIADASDDLAAAMEGADANLVGLNGEIRTGTEEGRNLQAAFEDLAEQQSRAAQEYADGKLDATEYRIASAQVRAELDRVTAGSKLTQAQIDGLAEKYGLLPEDVETIIRARDEASGTLGAIRSAILGIPTSRTITVTTLRRASAGPNSPFRRGADGGPQIGQTLVGEEGPELAELSGGRATILGLGGPEIVHFDDRAFIYTARETARILAGKVPRMAEGGTAFREQLAVIGDNPNAAIDPEIVAPQSFIKDAVREVLAEEGRGPAVVIENWNVTDGRDSFQDLRNLEAVYRMSA